ncbi:hypothetical protein H1P_170017 [Hyella patelloides LEGE 07179]|uniref:Uncharacterized protein n=1 Tax=Hyella patelloides LEGE 07179 TaxID=945734 RepID=A0A563VN60_9CYAN|nr:hypothetical protein [Hyella patelloides]VEP12884.1 hypothetical protein H1P_170017 [Hyella patelloides LEGE 07179]
MSIFGLAFVNKKSEESTIFTYFSILQAFSELFIAISDCEFWLVCIYSNSHKNHK